MLIRKEKYIIRGVNIIDIINGDVDSNKDVLIIDGRISRIAKNLTLQESIYEIEGQDKYLLPGLFNMHTHATKANDYFLCLANGVTSVRHMWGSNHMLSLKEEFGKKPYLGPNIYASSAGFEQPPSNWPGTNLIQSKVEIRPLVLEQVNAGYLFLKVYENISRENYLELLAQSRAENIQLVGHI
ncbi:MAG: hypothetical protein RJQ14_09055, partial [Marinoscillum sp.]